jgi:protein-S-isoprenylcysteine O-methyltransferase Ste14
MSNPTETRIGSRTAIFVYGIACYMVFFITFLYAIGFVGNFLVPKSIDAAADGPVLVALLINTLLLGLFAVQHSVMARPAFKRWWTKTVPVPAERSTYVLFSSLALIALFAFWQPVGGVIWNVENPTGRTVLYTLFGFGWGLVLVSTFVINHFDLFGLRQVWLHLQGKPYTDLKFGTPGPYRLVRHPLYVGWFFAFWATPTMTVVHLFFAVVTTIYILIAIQLEEHDLTDAHPEYADYRRTVPMLVPTIRKKHATTTGREKIDVHTA